MNSLIQAQPTRIIKVAIPIPLRHQFDYFLPENHALPRVGCRVKVPFGKRNIIGIVTATEAESSVSAKRLKSVIEVLDQDTIFDTALLATLRWLSAYYLAPLGEVFDAALPSVLRKGGSVSPASVTRWSLSEYGRSTAEEQLTRAPLQRALVKRFAKFGSLSSADFAADTSSWRSAIKSLIEKGWLNETATTPDLVGSDTSCDAVKLTPEQQHAAKSLKQSLEHARFSCTLLHGVTGSGKTEVYFSAMRSALDEGKQVLMLVPEIGLTPALIERVTSTFSQGIVALHSGLSEVERHQRWWHAKVGNAGIIVGTRSAVFTPMLNPGLIVVDEEHDASFKQQDGVRYQARDVAIYRAKQIDIPIILGSATPALESWKNAQDGKYKLLSLLSRAKAAPLPSIELFDIRRLPLNDGLSPPMLSAIKHTLAKNKQVILFLNRRGYAPVLYCIDCGHVNQCRRCDANLTFHQKSNRLRCHHCGYESSATSSCQACGQTNLSEIGEGTQRVEEALKTNFPTARIARIDRDSTRRKGELEALLNQASNHELDILLGTQLLTKGHDFANVEMVGVLGSDQGLYSTDFRAREGLFQQLLQVAGRAGRREDTGRVFIQTAFVNDPFFNHIQNHDYVSFATQLLAERASANFPPFGYFALVRAESTHQSKALQFLRRARNRLKEISTPATDLKVNDAIPAPMERRAGRYRAQLLVQANLRSDLNKTLLVLLDDIQNNKDLKSLASNVRWSLDVDPTDLY